MTPHPLHAFLLALLLPAPALVSAQVFRCEDAQGRITYTNTECPRSERGREVLPAQSAEEKAQQEAQYQQALQRRREEQQRWAEEDAARRKAEAERAAAAAARQPPVVAQTPAATPPAEPVYVPVPVWQRPPRPHMPPPPPAQPPRPNPQSPGYNCNVFRCYDGKGNTWNRP